VSGKAPTAPAGPAGPLRKASAAQPAVSLPNLTWLVASLALVTAPHLERLPIWVPLWAVLLFGWRLHVARRRLPLPPRWLLLPLAMAGSAGVFLSFGTVFGRSPGVAMLTVLIGLKLLETRNVRDANLMVFLGYFLVITNFLYSQSIPTAIYLLGVVYVITLALLRINSPGDPPPIRERMRIAGALLGQAIPLMVVLFVFFPRIPGPLWGLPADAHSGVAGLGDSMSPGTISELLLSGDTAFRVDFLGQAPPPVAQMYWRGPVLVDYDGKTWHMPRPGFPLRPDLELSGPPVRYEVSLEPHNKPWLFALEMPGTRPGNSALSTEYQLLALRAVRERMRYSLESHTAYRMGLGEPEAWLARALALPEGYNPRAVALAQGWRAQHGDPVQIVRRALAHFRREAFVYTLDPPPLGKHAVDEFLFSTRRGFCEHYASAFTFLMRAAGVPARVVLGYQGGEINPIGQYLIVRQADAHAWSEVWLPDRGWVRVDPTAAVAPERVESGIQAALPEGQSLPLLVRSDLAWLVHIRLALDSIGFRWNQWVVGYNPERQLSLLSRLGMRAPDWRSMAGALLAGAGTLLLAFTAWMLRRVAVPPDPVLAAYRRFCRKLARAGLARRPGEGPRDFARRVSGSRPGLSEAVERITTLYIGLRYGTLDDREAVGRLRRMVREFRA
jgi:transglutaminase-like putative cysteine protease